MKPLNDIKYDVLFVGRDKGKGDYLLLLEKKMRAMELKTKFIITADGRFSHRKSYYQEEISYGEIIDLIDSIKVNLEYCIGRPKRNDNSRFGVNLLWGKACDYKQ